MKKVFSMVCAGSLALLAVSCGGNKAADAADSAEDTVGVIEEVTETITAESIAPDSVQVQDVVTEGEGVITETKDAAKETGKKTTDKIKDTVNKGKDALKNGVEEGKDAAKNAGSKLEKAVEKTKDAAENGIDDTKAKAKSFKDRAKKALEE